MIKNKVLHIKIIYKNILNIKNTLKTFQISNQIFVL